LSEIVRREIQEEVDAGFYIRGVSPAFITFIPCPYSFRGPEEMFVRIGMGFKTVLEFKYGLGDPANYMALIITFEVFWYWKKICKKEWISKEQRITEHLFSDLASVCIYIDDVLISAETFQEHVQV
jgi:hypothetical protein